MEQGHHRLSCQTSLCKAPACPAKQKSMSDRVFFRKSLCAWPHSNRPTLCFWIFMIRSISHAFYVLESSQNITLHYTHHGGRTPGGFHWTTAGGSVPNWNIVHISYCFLIFFFLNSEPRSVPFCPSHLTHSSQLLASLYFLQHATVGISQSVGQCVTQVPT